MSMTPRSKTSPRLSAFVLAATSAALGAVAALLLTALPARPGHAERPRSPTPVKIPLKAPAPPSGISVVTTGAPEAGRAGGSWNITDIVERQGLGPNDALKWVYLAQGPNATPNVVFVRSNVRPHVHRTHDEVVYILRGTGTFRIGDREEPIGPGKLFFVPAGTVHGGTLDDGAALSIYGPAFDPANPDREFIP